MGCTLWPDRGLPVLAAEPSPSIDDREGELMSAVRVHNVAVSLDGYAAGPGQDLDHPLGVGGPRLHEWAFATSAFRRIHGMPDGVDGSGDEVDDVFVTAGEIGIGATV